MSAATARQDMAHFHRTLMYEHAVVAEHTVYVRKSASLLCASHSAPIWSMTLLFWIRCQYEALFAEYFELYLHDPDAERRSGIPKRSRLLLPLLKHQLNEWRWVILNPKQALPYLQRETELRRPQAIRRNCASSSFQRPAAKASKSNPPGGNSGGAVRENSRKWRFTIIMRPFRRNLGRTN